MYWDVALWSAGIWAILSLASGQLTEQEKSTIVDMHNKVRSQVKPSAALMQKVIWDEALRLVAEAFAVKCIWKHNPDLQKLLLGENLFMTTGPFNATQAMLSWFDENVDYNYENMFCPEDKMCGHYTQMVWADTNRIGCATQFCDTIDEIGVKLATKSIQRRHSVRGEGSNVFRLFHEGNVPGHFPYESGEPCSKCTENKPVCEENICVHENPLHPSEEPDDIEDPSALPERDVTEDPTVLPERSHWTTEPVDVPQEPTHVPVKVDETGIEKSTMSHGSKIERVTSHLLMLIVLALVL